jgi:uncharacterized membrane protein
MRKIQARKAVLVAAVIVMAILAGLARATPSSGTSLFLDTGRFTTVDVPGATATRLFAINEEGVAVGRYESAGRTHGFVRSATGELTTIDVPGAGFTVAGALNNGGDIVGWYTLPDAPAIRHGFLLRDGGEFASFDPPGSTFTNPLGINDRGDIVGRFCSLAMCREPGNGDFQGFLLHDGEFTILEVPGSIETNAWKINDRGEIVGGFGVAGGGVELFLLRKDKFTTFAIPNGMPLSEDNGGINARGDVVGRYCDASPCLIGPMGHGFVISGGALTTLDVPDALGTGAFGINARREVVGGYHDAGGVLHGYVMQLETRGRHSRGSDCDDSERQPGALSDKGSR